MKYQGIVVVLETPTLGSDARSNCRPIMLTAFCAEDHRPAANDGYSKDLGGKTSETDTGCEL